MKRRGMRLYLLYDLYMFLFCIIEYMLHAIYNFKLGMGKLRVMWRGVGGIVRASTFMWFPLFSREWTNLETKRSSARLRLIVYYLTPLRHDSKWLSIRVITPEAYLIIGQWSMASKNKKWKKFNIKMYAPCQPCFSL